jgi:nitrogen fixation NifU-like protein
MSLNAEMMQLYQEVILDHNRNPRNFHTMENPTHHLEGYNPLCGDHYHLYLKMNKDHQIDALSFEGQGCAISKASTSMMTSFLKGKNKSEALLIFEQFHQLLTGKLDPSSGPHALGKLQIFSGIWKYPARVKCASLAWHTLKNMLDGKKEIVKTE